MAHTKSGFSEASDLLSAALEQMDGILASNNYQSSISPTAGTPVTTPSPSHELENHSTMNRHILQEKIIRLTEELYDAINGLENWDEVKHHIPESTLSILIQFFKDNHTENDQSTSRLQTKFPSESLKSNLQRDNESLSLQVSILSDQLESQIEKIKELETCLHIKEKEVDAAESKLKIKTSLSSNEISPELSNLRTKLKILEKEKMNLEFKLTASKADSAKNHQNISEKDLEITDLKLKLKNSQNRSDSVSVLNTNDNEVDKLRKMVESLMKSGKEKDRTIDDLRDTINRFKRIQDLVLDVHESRRKLDTESDFEDNNSLASGMQGNDTFSTNSRSTPIRDFIASPPDLSVSPNSPNSPSNIMSHKHVQGFHSKPPIYPTQPPYYTPPLCKHSNSSSQNNLCAHCSNSQQRFSNSPFPNKSNEIEGHAFQPFHTNTNEAISPSSQQRSASIALLTSDDHRHIQKPSKTPPPNHTFAVSPTPSSKNVCATLPRGFSPPSARSLSYSEKSLVSPLLSQHEKHHFLPRESKTDTELTSDEENDIQRKDASRRQRSISGSSLKPYQVNESPKKERRLPDGHGLKKLFGKLKRSASTHLHKESKQPSLFEQSYSKSLSFNRTTPLRSTAVARLNWSKDLQKRNPNAESEQMDQEKPRLDTEGSGFDYTGIPFSRWDNEQVVCWLHDIGLNQYVSNCKGWIRNGETLLNASNKNLEHDLGIKNPLHRKKLLLALQAMNIGGGNSVIDDPSGRLDFNWVMRWLDDLGLPQYKDNFHDARIDGRMLNYLTVEDLLHLKVSNALHLISLKRGIQVLRESNFTPIILKRRPEPGESKPPSPEDVQLWTNHRTMEWLRSCNLSEYAPNLRGSGVHGALIILESRFNADALANLLSIPSSKTLLRRHLTLCFNNLVGQANLSIKRECESQTSFKPLTTTEKIKARRRSLTFAKKSKDYLDMDDFVCPMELGALHGGGKELRPNGSISSGALTMPVVQGGDFDQEKTAKQINVFSREISTLTNSLLKSNNGQMNPVSDDEIFSESSPSTIV